MSEIDQVVYSIGCKIQRQSLDQSKATIEKILSRYDCLHLRDQFFDSIQKHSPARINRVSLRDSMRFND